jgi:Fe-S cluster assembly protein SufD
MSALPEVQTAPVPTGSFTGETFAAHLAGLGHLPKWWLHLKSEAWNRFVALPAPARTDELWRFSNLAGLKLEGYTVASAPAVAAARPPPLAYPWAASLTFADNAPLPDQPAAAALQSSGVIFCPIEEAIVRHADLFRRYFMAQPVNLGSEKFAALNAAFTTSGAFLYVPKGVELAGPLAVFHFLSGPGRAAFPHTLAILEDNAKATLVEGFFSAGDAGDEHPAQLAAGQNDLHAGPGAQLTYVGVQQWSRETLAFQLNSTVVQRDARVRSLNLNLGGRQARLESHSRLEGPGGFSEMLALTVARHAQEFDQRTLQSHLAPNTGSNLLYKNVLLDQARTIFSGLIVVDSDAQKTDAYQSNRNLILSDEAEANSLPGLEIHANDVRCTHGATSGHLDAEQMFYLRSRGIPVPAARRLLVAGFFEEVLAKLESEDLRAALRALIETRSA